MRSSRVYLSTGKSKFQAPGLDGHLKNALLLGQAGVASAFGFGGGMLYPWVRRVLPRPSASVVECLAAAM